MEEFIRKLTALDMPVSTIDIIPEPKHFFFFILIMGLSKPKPFQKRKQVHQKCNYPAGYFSIVKSYVCNLLIMWSANPRALFPFFIPPVIWTFFLPIIFTLLFTLSFFPHSLSEVKSFSDLSLFCAAPALFDISALYICNLHTSTEQADPKFTVNRLFLQRDINHTFGGLGNVSWDDQACQSLYLCTGFIHIHTEMWSYPLTFGKCFPGFSSMDTFNLNMPSAPSSAINCSISGMHREGWSTFFDKTWRNWYNLRSIYPFPLKNTRTPEELGGFSNITL